MDDDDNIDWDAFGILAAEPDIDVATAYAASIRDGPPEEQPPQQSSGCAGLVIALLVALGVALLLLAI